MLLSSSVVPSSVSLMGIPLCFPFTQPLFQQSLAFFPPRLASHFSVSISAPLLAHIELWHVLLTVLYKSNFLLLFNKFHFTTVIRGKSWAKFNFYSWGFLSPTLLSNWPCLEFLVWQTVSLCCCQTIFRNVSPFVILTNLCLHPPLPAPFSPRLSLSFLIVMWKAHRDSAGTERSSICKGRKFFLLSSSPPSVFHSALCLRSWTPTIAARWENISRIQKHCFNASDRKSHAAKY